MCQEVKHDLSHTVHGVHPPPQSAGDLSAARNPRGAHFNHRRLHHPPIRLKHRRDGEQPANVVAMPPSKLRKAIGAVKDQTSIGLAKVGSGGAAASELDVAIVKATRHSESFPADERHVREVIALTLHSRAYIGACVASLSRRLGRTRSWAVALKTLALVHRLLADGDQAFEQEVFYATRRGTRMLNMSDFCDRSRTDAWDFSAFVRTYAAYLDDRLEYRMQAKHGGAARQGRPLREQLGGGVDGRERAGVLRQREQRGDAAAGAPMLALPAPPGTSGASGDPFAASMAVAPPAYVQMSDMETKQHQLVEEQMVWQQYGKNGMSGQGALAMLEQQRPPQQQMQMQMLPNGGYNYAGYHRSS
uniref:ENTH domain-containing protein n=1 Tax=Oryza barthii TaxID=65489 RepID=A0A0D3G7V7_9ORYZ